MIPLLFFFALFFGLGIAAGVMITERAWRMNEIAGDRVAGGQVEVEVDLSTWEDNLVLDEFRLAGLLLPEERSYREQELALRAKALDAARAAHKQQVNQYHLTQELYDLGFSVTDISRFAHLDSVHTFIQGQSWSSKQPWSSKGVLGGIGDIFSGVFPPRVKK